MSVARPWRERNESVDYAARIEVIRATEPLCANCQADAGLHREDLTTLPLPEPAVTPIRQRVFSAGAVRLDVGAHRVSVSGRDVVLTPVQYAILLTLFERQGQVVAYPELIATAWPGRERLDDVLNRNYAHLTMIEIRRALRPYRCITTVYGVGYRLEYHAIQDRRRSA